MTTANGEREEHPDTLLPWHVNGTLEGEERTLVLSHLETCDRCRGEVEFLQGLRESVKAAGEADAPGELELRRFMKQLDPLDAPAGGPTLRRWVPLALAASLALVAVQGVLLFGGGGDEGFELLGGRTDAHLQVRFAPDASEADIRELLQSSSLVIVEGPGAGGLYRLRSSRPEVDAGDIMRVMEQLDSHPDVVTYVATE